jgi:protein O-GlcNAc transferase
LRQNIQQMPLFDTERFTRNIETAYTTMWQRWQRGEPPQGFAVNALHDGVPNPSMPQ